MTATLAPAPPGHPSAISLARDEAIAWLYGRINYEYTPPARRGNLALRLERMRELIERLGSPGLALPTVHIAGTKGKGSTAAMVASILRAADYRTGLFTSPHLERIEERFSIDGVEATPDEFVELAAIVRPVVEEMDAACAARHGSFGPTFFEICTAIALLHFERRCARAIVLEVGLGGRLDSTNICRPDVCAITSISFDHTRQLGNTLAEIAREKAGIIKPLVPVVSGVTAPEPRRVIEAIAAERNSHLIQRGRDFTYVYRPGSLCDATDNLADEFEYLSPGLTAGDGRGPRLEQLANLRLPLLGEHQAANAAVAVATACELVRQGWNLPVAAVRQGLQEVRLPARAEVVRRHPTVILDTAHNVASIRALVDVLQTRFTANRRHLVFAPTQDKDVAGMLDVLLPHFETVRLARYTTNPRGVPLDELEQLVASRLARLGPSSPCTVVPHADPHDAWQHALRETQPDDLICITGSFFLAAELRHIVCWS